ncbi:N-chimaerin-like isoform X1 [Haemaphysalis longicornis]
MARQFAENMKQKHHMNEIPQVWKSYLYQLQQKAPTPKRIVCNKEVPNRPAHYGREFHGIISREEAERLLQEGDGCYLVRESQRAPGQYTLSLRFGSACKNFRLYHDGLHYVGEKRFATLQDLVADGLITMYLETYAGEYINSMCAQSRYEDSPYMTLHSYQRQLRHKQQQSLRLRQHRQPPPATAAEQETTHEYDKPDEELDCPLLDGIPEDINVQDFEKPHAFKVNNFKGLPWCDFCGNFMWGLIAQGVRCEDCGFSAHNRCSEKVPNDCLPDTKYVKRVFGVDLTTLVKAHNTPRPFVLDMCIKEIEQRGLDTEGIYRVSGFSDEVEALRMSFEKDGESAPLNASTYEDVHVVAGVLKLFLRLLPIPLITFDSYTKFFDAVKSNKVEEKLEAMKEAVKSLPPAHYQSLKYLMSHLQSCSPTMRWQKENGEELLSKGETAEPGHPDVLAWGYTTTRRKHRHRNNRHAAAWQSTDKARSRQRLRMSRKRRCLGLTRDGGGSCRTEASQGNKGPRGG